MASYLSTNPASSRVAAAAAAALGGADGTSTTAGNRRRHGAYSVVTESQGDPNFFHLPIPAGVVPGETFEFTITNIVNGRTYPRRLTVRCPPEARPGQDTLQLAVLQEPKTIYRGPLKIAPLTSPSLIGVVHHDNNNNKQNQSVENGNDNDGGDEENDENDHDDENNGQVVVQRRTASSTGGGTVSMKSLVKQRNVDTMEASAETLLVTVPENVVPGGKFVARRTDGSKFLVSCPPNAHGGQTIRIVLSSSSVDTPTSHPNTTSNNDKSNNNSSTKNDSSIAGNRRASVRYKFFEVVAPPGVQPNQTLPINVLGKRIPLKMPDTVVPGQTIKLKVPIDEVVDNVELEFENTPGWNRTIRMNDFKFQWIKNDGGDGRRRRRRENPSPPNPTASDPIHNNNDDDDDESPPLRTALEAFKDFAFVRHITLLEGNDSRMRTGLIEFIPAQDAVVESELTIGGYKTLVSYANVAHIQTQPLDEKRNWFQSMCSDLSSPWEAGRIQIVVRRQNLLDDSLKAVMSLSRSEMRRKWRIDFQHEPAVDAGGVMREWFELVTEQLFNPDFGLWLSSANNQICMKINPACHVSCPEDHLLYFRFLGRMMGRALFDRQLIKGHMVRYLYKHLLGWPITFEDLESQDDEYFQSLKEIASVDGSVLSNLFLDFTIAEEVLGERQTIELIQGGAEVEVNDENRLQYLEAILRYRMLERNKPQIQELLLGWLDVVPEPALSVFDPSELELLMCGLPILDMDDWQSNTVFTGNLREAKNVQCVEWFWDILRNDFDQEMKARLLQFATGTSGVPLGGFSVLQGNDGNIKLFTLHGVDHRQYPYPRAHTCFNRIDLPNYSSKTELRKKLKIAVTVAGVGFDIE